jgi:hypothetical protein
MRKLIFGYLLLFVVNHHASAQLYKGQWMAGGNVSVTTYNNYFFKYNSLSATAVPNIGYFFVDKLAGGLDFYVNWGETKFSYNFTTYGFSPFLRYYFLPAENKVNIFANTSFGWQIANLGHGFTQWTLSAGPSVFISSNFAVELALQYAAYSGGLDTDYHPRNFAINIGFQFHFGAGK